MSVKPTYEELERHGRQADITIENLEQKLEKLAAESAGLKELIEQHANSVAVCPNCSHEEPSETDDIVALYRSMETPATEAVLSEVRAQGVEMFAEVLKNSGAAYQREFYADTGNAYIEASKDAVEFAAQIRKGVQS